MSAAVDHLDYDALAARFALAPTDDRDEQIRELQEYRAVHLDALRAPIPAGTAGPSASMLHLRASRPGEIAECEEALRAMGAPLDPPDEEDA